MCKYTSKPKFEMQTRLLRFKKVGEVQSNCKTQPPNLRNWERNQPRASQIEIVKDGWVSTFGKMHIIGKIFTVLKDGKGRVHINNDNKSV